MRKKSGRKRPYFTVKSAMTAILRDASGKMHRGILFDRRLLSTLRQKFWRNQGRREVKRVIRRVACQKQRVGPCAENGPIAGRESFMFTSFCGCWNWFRRTSLCKRSFNHTEGVVCLFTCASFRMIHLELTHSLTTDEFLRAFSRMTSRGGLCHTVWSDNAKTFKAASKEIQKENRLHLDNSVRSRLVTSPVDFANWKEAANLGKRLSSGLASHRKSKYRQN